MNGVADMIPASQKAAYATYLVNTGVIKDSTPVGEASAAIGNPAYQTAFLQATQGGGGSMTKVAVNGGNEVQYKSVPGSGLLGTMSFTLIFQNATGGKVSYYAFDFDGFRLTNDTDANRAAATDGSWGTTSGARITNYTGTKPVQVKNITYNSLLATSVNLEFSMVDSQIDGGQQAKPINFAAQVSPFQNQPGVYKFPANMVIDASKMLRLAVATLDTVSVTFDVELVTNVYGMSTPQ